MTDHGPARSGLPERIAARVGTTTLPVRRRRDRLSAYVYGNILVLSAMATLSPARVEDGEAVLVVLGTTVTTYLAHILAHVVGAAVGRSHAEPGEDDHLHDELRDAAPIVSSGVLPVVLLALGWWTDLDPQPILLIATATLALRLAGLGLTVARLSGEAPTRFHLFGGLTLGIAGGAVVALKVLLLH